MITIYTDGSFSSSKVRGGIGIVFVKDGNKIGSFSKSFENITNNKAELAAVIIAMKTTLKNNWEEVTICTDSQYVIGCATKGWQRKKNVKLWKRFDLVKEELDKQNITINFRWVRGHDGDKFNELADRLAVNASHETALNVL